MLYVAFISSLLQPSVVGEPTAAPRPAPVTAADSESPPAAQSVAHVSVQATRESAAATGESSSTRVEEEVVVHSPSAGKDVSVRIISTVVFNVVFTLYNIWF